MTLEIKIVHLKRSGLNVDNLIPMDRSTPLGNDFSHLPNSKAKYVTDTVEQAVAEFTIDLKAQIKQGTVYAQALEETYQRCLQMAGVIHFGCWCMDEYKPSPKDHMCHTQVIRKLFLNRYKRENKEFNHE